MLTGPALSAFASFHSSECAAVVNVPGANGAVAEERSSAKAIEEIAAKPIAAQRAVLTMRTSLLPLWGRHDFAKHGETGHPYELTEGGGRSRGAAPRSDRATRRRAGLPLNVGRPTRQSTDRDESSRRGLSIPRSPEVPFHARVLLGLEPFVGALLLQGETPVLGVRLLIAHVEAIAAVRVGV